MCGFHSKCARLAQRIPSSSRIPSRNAVAPAVLGIIQRMKRHRTQSGFTLLEVLGILSIVFVLALFMLPRMARAKCKCGLRCINNLKQVSLSFKQWSLDNNDRFPWQVSTNDGGAKEWIGSGSVWQYFLVISNELN